MDGKIRVEVDIDLGEIAWATRQLSDDQIVELVKEVDEMAASWDVTEQLYKHFKAQHKILKEERNNDV